MPAPSATLDLAMELLRRRSITPNDAGCQPLLGARLQALGFTVEHLRYGQVDNLWAIKGDSGPLFCFLGHTDVVPPGDESAWQHPPFEPRLKNGQLSGRGAADMKGSLAAMLTATERFIRQCPQPGYRLAWLLTSDEEGPATDGTARIIEHLKQQGIQIDWCLVGEPSSSERLGDTLKNGRRGSLGGHLRVHGKQGHVAYPQHARNPIHLAAPALARLAAQQWGLANAHFPATRFQISNLAAGTGATNVIPATLEAHFNFRFSNAQTAADLQAQTTAILADCGLHAGTHYELDWNLSGQPFLTTAGPLLETCITATESVTGQKPRLSTAGGTSDGRFVAPTGAQVVELGPVNASIHQVDEHVRTADLDQLADIYTAILLGLTAHCSPATRGPS
ncbi:MAG: succinyl-diaminopimelate desuccinylase [Cellvibrionales bacterium]|nr:succinyl-diaminopimelate desuccinylase [Cellvibrionales bacterium]